VIESDRKTETQTEKEIARELDTQAETDSKTVIMRGKYPFQCKGKYRETAEEIEREKNMYRESERLL